MTFLPAIVDAAESSPAAAAECARIIRKYLHKDFWTKPSFQYNAIMLIRILADNPGQTFTRALDKKFVDVAKELLRYGRDASVRQMLMETLDAFEATKGYDEGLGPILEMWRKEKEKAYKAYGVRFASCSCLVRRTRSPTLTVAPSCTRFHPHNQSQSRRCRAAGRRTTRTPRTTLPAVIGASSCRSPSNWPTGSRRRARRPSFWSRSWPAHRPQRCSITT